MNPITHAAIGWLIAQPLPKRRDRILVTMAGLIPDIDGLPILWSLDSYGRFHHTFSHNLLACVIGTLLLGLWAKSKFKTTLFCFLSLNIHCLCDLLGSGYGWPLWYFWPLSNWNFSLPSPFQWELASWQNMLITVICLIAIGWVGVKKKRTIVEIFSLSADRKVVQTLQKRFSFGDNLQV